MWLRSLIFVYFTFNVGLCSKRSLITDVVSLAASFVPGPEDAYLTIQELAEKYGYPLEDHEVTTEDGYILNMHRIPYGKTHQTNGKIVFLMHGLSDVSDSWLLQGPDNSLAYILADEGYDVWMGNARGNKHSNKHITLNTNSSQFWMFSWEEIGLYDLPAMIDYTLQATGHKSLYYVGYSQGTTTILALLSTKPEYNSKIQSMFGLAPVVFMGNAKSPILNILCPAQDLIEYVMSYFELYSPSESLFVSIAPVICKMLPNGCDNIFYNILGPNNVKEDLWPIILGHSPSGASTFQYMHYSQLRKSKKFNQYDYGEEINEQKYGQSTPPEYELDKVTCPVILFYGGNDWFSDRIDVEKLLKILPNVQKAYFIKAFGHSDYVYADDAKKKIYRKILKHLKKDTEKPDEVPRFRYKINN